MGGVDVARARATVDRAVRASLGRGDVGRSFVRLVAVHDAAGAVEVLAQHGAAIIDRGDGTAVGAFARSYPDAIEHRHDAWFSLALERWEVGDVDGASAWMDRLLDHSPGAGAEKAACMRLMRARLGMEPMDVAVANACEVVEGNRGVVGRRSDVVPLLLCELGITQGWVGDLEQAEENLSAAVVLCHAGRRPALAASAMSHLALTLYMAGREQSSARTAAAALELFDDDGTSRSTSTADRASLALTLAGAVDLPWQDITGEPRAPEGPVHPADLCTSYWRRMRTARTALARGSVAEAERVLSTPGDPAVTTLPLPSHLRVALLVERAFLAALSFNERSLTDFEEQLTAVPALGEAALVGGLRADLVGDLHGAVSLFADAAQRAAHPQPASRALALTCQAQLLDALGDRSAALDRLHAAATTTEVRRNAVPFLGWTRMGTPVQALLQRLSEVTRPSTMGTRSWVHELANAAGGRPDVRELFAVTTATPWERRTVAPSVVQPPLSPREREVLLDLARGATYADIAAHLFLSENTVKTHISSLYSKLAVSRRSEALAVARTLQLL